MIGGKMRPNDTCWRCRHLISRVHSRPPVYCSAYPDGAGIALMILAGQVRHDHLLGDEKELVTFERGEERGK